MPACINRAISAVVRHTTRAPRAGRLRAKLARRPRAQVTGRYLAAMRIGIRPQTVLYPPKTLRREIRWR